MVSQAVVDNAITPPFILYHEAHKPEKKDGSELRQVIVLTLSVAVSGKNAG